MSLTFARNLAYTSVSLLLSASILIIVHTAQPVIITSRIGIQMKACTATRFEYYSPLRIGVGSQVWSP